MGDNLKAYMDEMEALLPEVMRSFRGLMQDIPEMKTTTPVQFFLLHKLEREGPCNASAIAQFMGITSGSVTSITERLVKHGLISRVQDATDRRIVIFALTASGQDLLHAIREQRKQKLQGVFEQLGEEKTRLLLALYKDMKVVLDDML